MKKAPRGKLPFSILMTIISGLALTGLIFTDDLRVLHGISIVNKFTARKLHDISNSTNHLHKEDELNKPIFAPNECSVTNGKWVFNESKELLYSDSTCPFLDKQVTCTSNGRPDTDYLFWEWQLDDCILPRFDAKTMLEKIRGKRLMFVGDSLQRAQWMSLVCLVQSIIPTTERYMNQTHTLSIFTAKEYNATLEFYWAPFLIESNTDGPVILDQSERILRIDSIANHAKHWVGVDILVFDTYVWWQSGQKIKSLWGSLTKFEELDATVAYGTGLKTWANWIDSTLDPNTTKVFFTTMSPTHMRSADWNHENNIRCFNETKPVPQKGYWGTGSDRRIMEVVSNIVSKMITPVTFLNITQLSEHRIDGHVAVYTESQGRVLTDEQKANPQQYVDCIHWCLPGIPDTWNQLLYASL